MTHLTDHRERDTIDELWLLQHPAVFTFGQAGKAEHLLDPHGVPVVKSDRGGQITYHGPGQLIAYPLLNLHRLGFGVREFVNRLEQVVIDVLANYHIQGERRISAPGVYIKNAKIAALGLRVRRGYTFHGLSFNIDMDLQPFSWINPCGYPGLAVTQLKDQHPSNMGVSIEEVGAALIKQFCQHFGFATVADVEN